MNPDKTVRGPGGGRILILNRRDVEALLPMPRCIELMEAGLASLARGEVLLPLRSVLRLPGSSNVFALMPAYSRSLSAIAAKLITVFPGNHDSGLDSHQGAVMLFDGDTGTPVAVMDAGAITAIRTAAVSGVATRLLARADARTLAILGAGVQARTHIDAMLAVRPFRSVRIWSRNAPGVRALVEEVRERTGLECVSSASAADAVTGADVVCTVTAAREPVLHGEWLESGAHVNAVGASVPTARELDTEAIVRARVFVDRRESALHEAGDLLIPIREGAIDADHIAGELGDLLTGTVEGRRRPSEITLFKSLGIALEDLAAAHDLYTSAAGAGRGTWVDFGGDPR